VADTVAAYDGLDDELPPGVLAAVRVARAEGFPLSCLPGQGRLLRALAGGATRIGETGTGCGVGLAWLARGAGPDARLVSVECDPDRARLAAGVFAGEPRVRVRTGDWRDLVEDAPFDLLVLDGGGGSGKTGDPPLDPARWLRPGGVLVIDDFTPMDSWPPLIGGEPDTARLHWLRHPRLLAAEVRVAASMSTVVATYVGASTATPVGVNPDRF